MNALSLNNMDDFFQDKKELTNSLPHKGFKANFKAFKTPSKHIFKSMEGILNGDRKAFIENQSVNKFFNKNPKTHENEVESNFSTLAFANGYTETVTTPSFSISDSLLRKIGIFLCCVAIGAVLIPALVTHVSYLVSFNSFSFVKDPTITGAMYGYVLPAENSIEKSDVDISLDGIFIQPVTFTNYTIKSGDNVDGLVKRFGLKKYGTLIACNKIANVNRLQVGSSLRIPSMDGIIYQVSKGDSLSSIAKSYALSKENILDANDLASETLTVGQELFLPGIAMNRMDLRKALGEFFVYPLHGRLTSGFGFRANPFTGTRQFHGGIDLAAPRGTKIGAVLDGKVAKVGYNNTYGNYVIIVHDNTGYQTLYGHLSSVAVKQGSNVTQGQKIGGVGSTGYSTGNHLHLSVYKNGCLINPFTVLDRKAL